MHFIEIYFNIFIIVKIHIKEKYYVTYYFVIKLSHVKLNKYNIS